MLDTIFLHAGLPKTGTSAIQEGLRSLSRAGLLARVGYPCPDPAAGAGNGTALARELIFTNPAPTPTGRLQSLVGELVAANAGRAPNLLISSEDLCYADVEKFSRLREVLRDHARSVRLLVAVRPFRPWSYSVYLQLVKAHALAADFDAEWLRGHARDFLWYFRNLDRFGVDTTVFRYRHADLLRHFLGLVGEDEALAAKVPDTVANRSLAVEELGVLRAINAVFADEALGRAVSDAFARRWPERQGARFPADRASAFAAFAADFARQLDELPGPVMDQVKAILFAPGDEASAATPAQAAPERLGADELEVALRALREHFNARIEDAALHRGLLDYSAGLARTADAFDPVHYLLMHPDVLRAGTDPRQHFEQHGRAEGRPAAFIPPGADPSDRA
ncbi:hypothetical protein [Arenimonas sp.]|uniref:hypothetical protein n=1 Tax=Arenimonas sp. TaxID=1872635 RepID=UPI0025C3B42E|nr:hypothetical protein [Arenimonas sp.]